MAGKKRCFVTVRALRRLDEKLLCAVLGKFPEHLATWGLVLPDPYGRIASHWEKTAKTFKLEVHIPPNSTATVFLPDHSSREVGSGRYQWTLPISSL